jgi:cytochrome c biogenesis protein CcmG/thiol:disulfide interchange protein DsbE
MRALFITPLIIFLLVLMVLMAKLLDTDKAQQTLLVGEAVPEFSLPKIDGSGAGLSSDDLKGHYSLINIFASWCLTCKVEHPFLMKIKESGELPIYGIDWKDDSEKVTRWLKEDGNPYEKIGADKEGKVILELGVTGAPETFLISPEGVILYRYAGILTESIWKNEILARVR